MKTPLLALFVSLVTGLAWAETRVLTLKQAAELASRQNPDLLLARLDEQRAALEVRAASEPVLPRTVVGSGLAYTHGFPLSIEGAAPSLVRAQATRSLYNPVLSYGVAQTRELARAQTHSTAVVREDVLLRVSLLFLDLERRGRDAEAARRQVESLERIAAVVRQRVAEGRELEIEDKRARLNIAKARQRLASIEGVKQTVAHSLATLLGFDGGDVVEPAAEDRPDWILPPTEERSVEEALAQNREIQKLESEVLAKGLAAKSFRAARLPKIELVAQYALFARFNNYEDYFRTFSRHNGQIGASILVPVFPDSSQEARAAQSDVDARRLKTQLGATRNRIQDETRKAWQRIREAEGARDVARLDLEVARDQVTILLTQMEEGRVSLRQVEEARFSENEKWLLLYEARYQLERARLELLKETSGLSAALR